MRRQRRSRKSLTKVEKFTVPKFPKTAAGWVAWLNLARCNLVAASGRSQEAFEWFEVASETQITWELLGDTGSGWRCQVDDYLRAAITTVLEGEIGRHIISAQEEEQAKKLLIRGRHASRCDGLLSPQ